MKRAREKERERLSKVRGKERARLQNEGPMRGDTHGDQKRGGKHIAAYHHRGITVVTQHATERATEREREIKRERRESRERKREREKEKERGGCWFVGRGC